METKKSKWATNPTPERIREARNSRGRAIASVAEALGISRQVISCYENGTRVPTPETLQNYARELNFPISFFFPKEDDNFKFQTATFFRSMKTTENAQKLMFCARLLWIARLVRDMKKHINLPRYNLPEAIDIPIDTSDDTMLIIEDTACNLRKHWGLGLRPISNVMRLAEANGIIVCTVDCGETKIDACSQIIDNNSEIMISEDKQSACRLRFDVMHEVGHLLLHSSLPMNEIEDKKVFDIIEKQAHRFASAFLMPKDSFPHEVFTVSLGNDMIDLKKRWGASIGAIIYRCKDLGVYSEDKASRLFAELGKRRWRTNEPLDDVLPVETPILLKSAYEYIRERNADVPIQLFNQSSISEEDFVALTGYADVKEKANVDVKFQFKLIK